MKDLITNVTFLTSYMTFNKNGGLNLVLWPAKPPACMTMIKNITKMTSICKRNTAQTILELPAQINVQTNNTTVTTKM